VQTRYNQFNPKRRILLPSAEDLNRLQQLAQVVAYGGNPEHKKNPGDFGLTPPSYPRRGKSLCDVAAIFTRAEARRLLQEGLRKGLVSDRHDGPWPKNIWAVTPQGVPLEAQLENPESGIYHGYPMPESDPLASEVKRRWGVTA
jgi:hypothetical protein